MSKLNGQPPNPIYEFGHYQLEVAERRLLRAGELVRLPPKVFDLLVALVENNGRLVEKEELMTKVWPDSFVEEGNINRNISTLRRALNGDGDEFIETVPKRGYRFIAPVRMLERSNAILVERYIPTLPAAAEEAAEETNGLEPQATDFSSLAKPRRHFSRKSRAVLGVALVLAAIAGWSLWRWRAQPVTPQINTVAILPFKFLGANKDDEYLGLGLTDTLITRLASLKSNFVRPTSAVLKYQRDDRDVLAAGHNLRVDGVLDGYVQKFGEMVNVRLQLIRVADGALLNTIDYARPASDLLLLHDAVTKQVAQSLALSLTAEQQQQLKRRYRDNADAYNAYLQGRYYWNRRGPDWYGKALAAFERAIAFDPKYALAFTGISDTYLLVGDHGVQPHKEALPKAREAAIKALEIDESLAEAHTALAAVKSVFDWDWAAAEQEYKRAIELDPNYALAYGWYAVNLRRLRRFDEAVGMIQRAQTIEPALLSLYVYASFIYRDAGQFEQAVAQTHKALDFDPDYWTARYQLGRAYSISGRYAEALAEAERVASLIPDNPAIRAELGYVLARAGKREEARKILAELKELSLRRYVRAYFIATVHLGLDEHELALEWLGKSLEERDSFMADLAADARYHPLRAYPRFNELLRQVGLPTELHDKQ